MKIIECIECPKCGHLIKMENIHMREKVGNPSTTKRKKRRTSRRWHPSEDRYLKDNLPASNCRTIAKALKRTIHAVECRANLLGIHRRG